MARVPNTTSNNDSKEFHGYTSTGLKGAGIRVYEYADKGTTKLCCTQLEYYFWQCGDIEDFIASSSDPDAMRQRKLLIEREANERGLADQELLKRVRIFNRDGHTICPLCLKEISARGFGEKIQLAEGRDVPDTTVTDVSLFHIRELRTGEFNHKPYNLGWGHHFCNVVVKDAGIQETLVWMRNVLSDNDRYESENR